jgi:hypothetical protein
VLLLHFCVGNVYVRLADLLALSYHRDNGRDVYIYYNRGVSRQDWDNHLHVVYTPVGTGYARISLVSYKIDGDNLASGAYGFATMDDTRHLQVDRGRYYFDSRSMYSTRRLSILDESLVMLNALRRYDLDHRYQPVINTGTRTAITSTSTSKGTESRISNRFSALDVEEGLSDSELLESKEESKVSPERQITQRRRERPVLRRPRQQQPSPGLCRQCFDGVCRLVSNCFA